jgi:hypothetical protein
MHEPHPPCVAGPRRALAVGALMVLGLGFAPSTASAQSPGTSSTASEAPASEAFTTNDEPRLALVTSANELWLRQMYRVILGRPADEPGVTYWLGRLASGGDSTRGTVATRFLFSREGAQGEVDRAYAQLLGRSAEPGGREFWTDYLTVRPVTVLRSNLLASDELLARSGSVEAWLTSVYRELLGRSPDPSGLEFWSRRVREGMNRYVAVSSIYYSPEGLGRRVDAIYAETLQRSPSAIERSAGSTIVLFQDERRLRVLTLAGDEYFQAFLDQAASAQ